MNTELLICFRLLCRDSGGETESMLLNESVPPWVIDITVDVSNSMVFTWISVENTFYIRIRDCLEHLVAPGAFAMHSGWCRPGGEWQRMSGPSPDGADSVSLRAFSGLTFHAEVNMKLLRAHLRVCFVPEKYAEVQQNPILPPATFVLRRKNAEEVSARSSQ